VAIAFVVLTDDLCREVYFKLCVVELVADKFAHDDFAHDMTNEILQAGEVLDSC
jgi:hypothetical protein